MDIKNRLAMINGEDIEEKVIIPTDIKSNKYVIVDNDACKVQTESGFIILHRIRSLKTFADVKANTLGGFVESYKNLSQEGDCWIYNNSKVYMNAKVLENAKIENLSMLFDNSIVKGNSIVRGKSTIGGESIIEDNVVIMDNSAVYSSILKDNVIVKNNSSIYKISIFGNNVIEDESQLENMENVQRTW
jgi:NDP-sugar pyrophosphorylase family protein